MEFRVLGSLEACVGGVLVPLGGAKQRAVLAAFLLRADEVLAVERLVDEVWGDDPPPSAVHSLEAYVSRIRQLLADRGPSLRRRGAGYCLELRGATLDAHEFERLADAATGAALEEDYERASRLVSEALALWRGPALADVALASSGRADAERLEELRLRMLELRFDAELELGRDKELVGELQALVGQNPYREQLVAQLMLALYRSGRQAEALEVYERTRRRLDEDLGLQPSAELRQLSGRIVRQEPDLRRPAVPPARGVVEPPRASERIGRVTGMVLAGVLVAATTALTANGSAPEPGSAVGRDWTTARVALLLPRAPEVAIDEPRVRDTTATFRQSAGAWGDEAEIVVADEIHPVPDEIASTIRRIEAGRFASVLVVGGGATARALAPLVRRLGDTRFVFIDESLSSLSLEGVRNATGMPFADHETSRLVGYLSGLIPPQGGRPKERADAVSIVASRATPHVERLVRAYTRGARQALPRVRVRVDYAPDERDKTACERIANDQIDAGSDVVFAIAGACSSSVLEVAKLRGVWGIRVNDDGVPDGPHIVATTYKRWEKAVRDALYRLEFDTLPRGRDYVLGLADDYAVDAWGGNAPEVHAAWSKVARLCSSIRARTETDVP